MQTYEIRINEEQRAIITALLIGHTIADPFPKDEPIDEAALLRDMFIALPAAEDDQPNCIHGFAL